MVSKMGNLRFQYWKLAFPVPKRYEMGIREVLEFPCYIAFNSCLYACITFQWCEKRFSKENNENLIKKKISPINKENPKRHSKEFHRLHARLRNYIRWFIYCFRVDVIRFSDLIKHHTFTLTCKNKTYICTILSQ